MANDIAVRQDSGLSAGAFEPQNIDAALNMCKTLVASGMFGTQAKAEALLVKIVTGRELGLSAMQSIRSLYTFESNGRLLVGVDAAALVACANRHPQVEYFKCVESTDELSTWEIKRRDRDKPDRYTYTIAMAKKAGLSEKAVWKAHPSAMLRARCSTAMIRMHVPEAAMSFLNTDEFDEVRANEEQQPPPQRAHVEQTSAGTGPHYIVQWTQERVAEIGVPITHDQACGIRDDAEAQSLQLTPRDAGVMVDVGEILYAATTPAGGTQSKAEYLRAMQERTPAFDELRRLLDRAMTATIACEAYADHGAHESEKDSAFAKGMLLRKIQRLDDLDGTKRTNEQRGAWIKIELANLAQLKADAAKIEAERAKSAGEVG